jgi:hypothetical protein
MARTPRPKQKALTESAVDALLDKLRNRGKASLDDGDYDALLGVVETWAHLTELAASESASISEVRRLLGIRPRARPDAAEAPGANASAAENEDAHTQEPTPEKEKRRSKHGRRDGSTMAKLNEAHHTHTMLNAGDVCPDCARGRLYKYRPSVFTTISGQAPLVATRHTLDALQCNGCKQVFRAPLPEAFEDDGVSGKTLYSYSAVAMVAIYRCFAGMPMHRQQSLQKTLGVHVPDASIWDMCERLADVLRPVRRYLATRAAQARLFYGDDTGATILDERKAIKARRSDGEKVERTGCHTTCVIAITDDEHAVVLFATGLHHTGEVMDAVLTEREPGAAAPIFMGDCVASNTVSEAVVLYAGCNAHAVRRFKELLERYPEQAGYALERYGAIYDNEAHCSTVGLSGEARRDYHQRHSRGLLREIAEHGHELMEQRLVEPNSDVGEAYGYVINNERRLSAFARHPFAPLDNNACERTLRLCVQLRESARFFRNSVGASVADTLLTVGGTAKAEDRNLFDYFVAVQRHAEDVRAHPELWLPWCYEQRVAELRQSGASATGPP